MKREYLVKLKISKVPPQRKSKLRKAKNTVSRAPRFNKRNHKPIHTTLEVRLELKNKLNKS